MWSMGTKKKDGPPWSVGPTAMTPSDHVVAVVQARTGSTRLPGKVLADVAGRSMLARVCERLAGAGTIDRVIVATTTEPADRAVAAECARLGVPCFRGSAGDVLGRYHGAAAAGGAGVVVRVTADCPLIDPDVVDRVVRAFLDARPDYASNTLKRTWPRGLDTEVFPAAALARAHGDARLPYEREHVTPHFYGHPHRFHLHPVTGPARLDHLRWTVDTADDLRLVRAIYARLGPDGTFSWRDAARLFDREPALAELNRHVRQKPLVAA